MKRVSALSLLIGWLLGAACVYGLTHQYTYQWIGGGRCESWQNVSHDFAPGVEIVPNQPNPCYLRFARFHLP